MTDDANPAKLISSKLFIKGTAKLHEQVIKELSQPDPDSDEAKALLSSDSENEDTKDNDGGGSRKSDGNCRRQDCP
jgi:hypothetical protein